MGEKDIAIWTVANQEHIDYGMPARVMMQDALSYDRQLKELKRQNQDFADSGNKAAYTGISSSFSKFVRSA